MAVRRQPRRRRLRRVLVANRGEIAVRVIRACRDLGLETVAVYSEADRDALQVRLADAAVCVGPPPAAESYLDVEAIVAAARDRGADAVHPGYGFLAENADFADAVERAGLVFVGPPGDVMRLMGSKVEARRTMVRAGVPVVPGSDAASDDVAAVCRAAARIDGPLMIKASAGGGGKGMRAVDDRAGLEAAVREAIGEARAAFGDGAVYVERRIERPRHVEVQVLADAHGNVVHLFERECSIQRRHQKVIEETPSPAISPAQRTAMGEAAVAAARAAGYRSAGTVEFLLDADGSFYFLEMNTRIQVEHPVTEAVTGVDLLAWQLRIAAGEAIDFTPEAVRPRGHAIECRLYAEDETRGYMPSCGTITRLREPSGPGIRVDSGVFEGVEVTPHYDPILAKIVAWGATRDEAIARMRRALDETIVQGVRTNVELHRRILAHPDFVAGRIDTAFLDRHADVLLGGDAEPPEEAWVAAALVEALGGARRVAGPARVDAGNRPAEPVSVWRRIGRWEIGGAR